MTRYKKNTEDIDNLISDDENALESGLRHKKDCKKFGTLNNLKHVIKNTKNKNLINEILENNDVKTLDDDPNLSNIYNKEKACSILSKYFKLKSPKLKKKSNKDTLQSLFDTDDNIPTNVCINTDIDTIKSFAIENNIGDIDTINNFIDKKILCKYILNIYNKTQENEIKKILVKIDGINTKFIYDNIFLKINLFCRDFLLKNYKNKNINISTLENEYNDFFTNKLDKFIKTIDYNQIELLHKSIYLTVYKYINKLKKYFSLKEDSKFPSIDIKPHEVNIKKSLYLNPIFSKTIRTYIKNTYSDIYDEQNINSANIKRILSAVLRYINDMSSPNTKQKNDFVNIFKYQCLVGSYKTIDCHDILNITNFNDMKRIYNEIMSNKYKPRKKSIKKNINNKKIFINDDDNDIFRYQDFDFKRKKSSK